MNLNRWGVGFLGGVLSLGMLFVGGCEQMVSVNSRWASGQIVVDGRYNEWLDGSMYYDEETNTKIGIRNDAQNLYLCLVCKDENIERQIRQGGFTLWVCQNKTKNKLWGLRYLAGADGSGDMGGFGGPEGRGAPRSSRNAPPGDLGKGEDQKGPDQNPPNQGQGSPKEDLGGRDSRASETATDFEILSSEDDSGQIIQAEKLKKLGVEESFSQAKEGGLVYEVKIPLNKTEKTPYAAVRSKNGDCLIGLVSEKTDAQGKSGDGMKGGRGGDMRSGMGSGGMSGGTVGDMGGIMNFGDVGSSSGGGMGGGGMGRSPGGGMGGGPGGGGMSRSSASSLQLWAMIELAANPGSRN